MFYTVKRIRPANETPGILYQRGKVSSVVFFMPSVRRKSSLFSIWYDHIGTMHQISFIGSVSDAGEVQGLAWFRKEIRKAYENFYRLCSRSGLRKRSRMIAFAGYMYSVKSTEFTALSLYEG